jgi:uncharacterized protein with HEPN domain
LDIVEASRRLTEQLHHQYAQVPCREVFEVRNRAVHGHFDLGLKVVWNTSCQVGKTPSPTGIAILEQASSLLAAAAS